VFILWWWNCWPPVSSLSGCVSGMLVRPSPSSRVPSSVLSPGPALSQAGAPPSQGTVRLLLPGRRRLMREEDSSGTDSDGEEGNIVVPSSSVDHLNVSGSKRPAPSGQGEASSGLPKRIRVPSPLPAPASSDSGIAVDSGASDSDVIYVRTERVSLSQTFLTSWLVRKV
jgi:hypothetical protein